MARPPPLRTAASRALLLATCIAALFATAGASRLAALRCAALLT
jgi:hypothetical protein